MRGIGIKTLLIILLAGICCWNLTGQKSLIDSLKIEIDLAEGQESKMNLLNKISLAYHRMDIDKTLLYAKQALDIANEIENVQGKARANINIGIYHAINGDYFQALEYFNIALSAAMDLRDYKLIHHANNNIGITYSNLGEYDKSIRYHQQAIFIAEKNEDEFGLSLSKLNVGYLYLKQKQYEDAIKYSLECIAHSIKAPEKLNMAMAKSNLVKIYVSLGDVERAKSINEEVFDIVEETGAKRQRAFALIHSADIYNTEEKPELAVNVLEEAIELVTTIGDNATLSKAYVSLFDSKVKLGCLDEAMDHLDYAINIEKKANRWVMVKNYMQTKTELLAEQADYRSAYEIMNRISYLNDSLRLNQKNQTLLELEKKYQSNRFDLENKNLRLLQEQQSSVIDMQKNINFSMLIISLLLLTIGILIFRRLKEESRTNSVLESRVKNRTEELEVLNKELLKSKEEMERFSFVSSHDLKLPITNVLNFSSLINKELENKDLGKINEYNNFILTESRKMRQLIEDVLEYTGLNKTAKNHVVVNLTELVLDIDKTIQKESERKGKVILHTKLPRIKFDRNALYLLFKKLIENGLQHNTSSEPIVEIEHSFNKNYLIIKVSDNGMGIAEQFHNEVFGMFSKFNGHRVSGGSGLGLSISKKIIQQLNGEIFIENNPGSGTTIILKIPDHIYIHE